MNQDQFRRQVEELIDSNEAKLAGSLLALEINTKALEMGGSLGTTISIQCMLSLIKTLLNAAPDEWGQELIRTRILEAIAPK